MLFVIGISGSGAGAETILLTKRKEKILRERVVEPYNLMQCIARKEVKKPWFLPALLPTFQVGALRKHAGGMFLASDLGGYAAVASIWFCTARQKWVAEGRPRPRGDETPLTLTSDPHTGRRPSLPPRRRLRRWSADGRTSPVRHRRQTRRHSRSGYPPPPHNSRRQCSPWR